MAFFRVFSLSFKQKYLKERMLFEKKVFFNQFSSEILDFDGSFFNENGSELGVNVEIGKIRETESFCV